MPNYRHLWLLHARGVAKKGRKSEAFEPRTNPSGGTGRSDPSLYGNYRKDELWKKNMDAQAKGLTAAGALSSSAITPAVSKLVFDWIAGWETQLPKAASKPVSSGQTHRFQ